MYITLLYKIGYYKDSKFSIFVRKIFDSNYINTNIKNFKKNLENIYKQGKRRFICLLNLHIELHRLCSWYSRWQPQLPEGCYTWPLSTRDPTQLYVAFTQLPSFLILSCRPSRLFTSYSYCMILYCFSYDIMTASATKPILKPCSKTMNEKRSWYVQNQILLFRKLWGFKFITKSTLHSSYLIKNFLRYNSNWILKPTHFFLVYFLSIRKRHLSNGADISIVRGREKRKRRLVTWVMRAVCPEFDCENACLNSRTTESV